MQVCRRVAPRHGGGFGFHGLVHGQRRVGGQQVLVELAPQQFVDPCGGAGLAAIQFAMIGCQRRTQRLPGRQHAGRQIRRPAAGAGQRREVALVLVGIDDAVGKGGQPVAGRGFAGGPQRAHGIACRRESVEGIGQRGV
ncbi:hypothetical protein G6F22_018710 [Rhizopus arrhizus]|nr:hypothetical protein G6F22_018710 [Rhizopus arrhizus]